MSETPRVVILSHDVVGPKMAGPGIRYFHLARVLAAHARVTLAAPGATPPEIGDVPFTLAAWSSGQDLVALTAQAEVVLAPSDLVGVHPQIGDSPAALVIDGYDPLLSEWLAMHHHLPLDTQRALWQIRLTHHAAQFHMGDFFICASERQRDWWLGQLEAQGRINPATYAADPTLRGLIDVVPYGLPETPPQATRPVIKGVWSGIEVDDRLVLWGGGLWPWLDPETAIAAMALLADQHPNVKLVFPGTRHPNPGLENIPTRVESARRRAADLGLLDKTVFFGDWVPYADWPSVLLESDVALTLHHATLETRLAFRTRILDYVWAGLPTVATAGDTTSDLVAAFDLGCVVDFGDTPAVAAALADLLAEPPTTRAARFAQARAHLAWDRVVAPLVAFCRAPRRAADRLNPDGWTPPHAAAQALQEQQVAHLQQALSAAQDENAYWRDLLARYEQGRVMRALRRINTLAGRFGTRTQAPP
jgi:hypothetical protein